MAQLEATTAILDLDVQVKTEPESYAESLPSQGSVESIWTSEDWKDEKLTIATPDEHKDDQVAAKNSWTKFSLAPFQSIALIVVGQQRAQFLVHQHLLHQECLFFQNYIDSADPDKGSDVSFVFPDVSENIIRMFLNWLYHNTVMGPENTRMNCLPTFSELIDLYILGEKLGAFVLLNTVVDCLVARFSMADGKIPAGLTRSIYHDTQPGSALRRLWVLFCIWGNPLGTPCLTEADFLHDMVVKQRMFLQTKVCLGSFKGIGKNEDFYVPEPGTGRLKERKVNFYQFENMAWESAETADDSNGLRRSKRAKKTPFRYTR